MIKNIISIICLVLGVMSALVIGIWTFLLAIQKPDATPMRPLIDNPELLILCIVSLIVTSIGGLIYNPRGKRRW